MSLPSDREQRDRIDNRRQGDDERTEIGSPDDDREPVRTAADPVLIVDDEAREFGGRKGDDPPIGARHAANRERHQPARGAAGQRRERHRRQRVDPAGRGDAAGIAADAEEHHLAEINQPAIAVLNVEAHRENAGDGCGCDHEEKKAKQLVHGIILPCGQGRSGGKAGAERPRRRSQRSCRRRESAGSGRPG